MDSQSQQPTHPLAAPYETAQILRRRLRAAVKGRDEVIDLIITALLADGHVLLEDYPGSGKTTLAKALGESVTEGTVTRWLKKVGDTVGVDEPLVEVSTDKVDTEIPSPVAGTLLSITAEEDSTVPVGGELATIAAAGSAPTPAPAVDPQPHRAAERAATRRVWAPDW